MKYFYFLILLVNKVFGANWTEMKLSQDYNLNQLLQVQQVERSKSFLDIQMGEKFRLVEINELDRIKVRHYKFIYSNCSGHDMKTVMDLVPVGESLVQVGVLIEKCHLELYINNKDILTNSFFE